ncbi:DMT family transporter [Paenibacillus lycopersici]|uniref:DMT family transporter n=1 Tax=Paenibacillus lycopersici TaxID=2704462 RepID=A0A6C0FWJ5_9BACL|nr:DMT family transporter [Paenibacillus lycopersici]QHT58560.1 DMT family transporter [Paenibacillus lycopersici]
MQANTGKLRASQNPYVLMPLLLLMWGSLAAVGKLLLRQIDSYHVMFYMYGFAVAAFAVIMLFKRSRRGRADFDSTAARPYVWTIRSAALLLACGLFSFLYDFLYMQSLSRIPAVEASMLNYLFPIFIVLFAVPIHKEKLNRFKLLSVAMGFLGTVLLMTKGDPGSLHLTNPAGDALAILAAVCWGLFTNLAKLNKQDMLMSTFMMTVIAFLLSACSLFAYSNLTLPAPPALGGVLWLGMSNIVIGFFLYFQALRYSPASLVASFTFFTPFVTLALIVLLLGEKPTTTDYAAALLILASVPVQQIGSRIAARGKGQLAG